MHVIQRGHNRHACFWHDTDRLVYLCFLHELTIKTKCAVHAYVLMTNHVHVLLTPRAEHSCAVLMRNLGQRYVQYVNKRYARSGTLWEGRYRSCLVDSAEYVLACHRYIELNPVRAGMAASAAGYRWSSHLGNIGTMDNKLLTAHCEYVALSEDAQRRQNAYTACSSKATIPLSSKQYGTPRMAASLWSVKSSKHGWLRSDIGSPRVSLAQRQGQMNRPWI